MANVNVKFGADTAGFKKGLSSVKKGIGSVVGMAAKIAGPLAAAAGIAGSLGAAFKGLSLAADMEAQTVAFETVMGSAERAKDMIETLNNVANDTPYQMENLVSAAKQLLTQSDKIGGDEGVIDYVKRLGDIAAVVGKEQLPELTKAFQKGLGKGTITAEVTDMFDERGVPLLKAFAETLGVTETKVLELRKAGKLTSQDLVAAIATLTNEGGKFYGGMEKAAGTFLGKLSTVKGKFNEVLRLLAAPLLEPLKEVLDYAISKLDELVPKAKAFGEAFGNGAKMFIEAFRGGWIGPILKTYAAMFGKGFVNAIAKGISTIKTLLEPLANIMAFYIIKGIKAGLLGTRLSKVLGMDSIPDKALDLAIDGQQRQFVQNLKEIPQIFADAPDLIDVSKEKESLDAVFQHLRSMVQLDDARKAAEQWQNSIANVAQNIVKNAKSLVGGGATNGAASEGGAFGMPRYTSSLQRIGGATGLRGSNPLLNIQRAALNEQKEQTTILKKISDTVGPGREVAPVWG